MTAVVGNLDHIIIAACLFGILIIGILSGRFRKMTREKYLLAGRGLNWILLGAAFLSLALPGCTGKEGQPNILFIMSDDHTYQGIGAYDDPRYSDLDITPTIDRLAGEGMLFTNVFCTNSICTPSRATILTGQYNHINQVRDLYDPLPPERQYLPIELKKAGYETAVVGKWHLRESPESFDYYAVFPGQGKYHDPVLYASDSGDLKEIRFDSRLSREVRIKEYRGHSSDVVTDISLDWLKNKRNKDKPFFLMHQFKAPHDMFENAERYDELYENVDFPMPGTAYEARWGSVATRGHNDSLVRYIGASLGNRNDLRNMGKDIGIDQALPAEEYRKQAYNQYMKRYFRCVKGVDDNIQRILDYLEEEGILENTIIIYTSDQGLFLGEHDFIDKRWMYEESLRMPLLIRYPKMIQAASKNSWIINNTDLAPTILELAGAQTPLYMQGKSFVAALKGEEKPQGWRTAHYYRYWMHMAHKMNNPAHFGIRTDRYKLIFFYGTDFIKTGEEKNDGNRFRADTPVAWELYDLENDPYEKVNIYEQMKGGAEVKELKTMLLDIRNELGDTDEDFPHILYRIHSNWN